MSEAATKLLEQMLQLSEAERAALADQLWKSLSAEQQQELLDDEPEDPAFEAELARRIESVENGTAQLLTWEEGRVWIATELERRRAARRQEPPA